MLGLGCGDWKMFRDGRRDTDALLVGVELVGSGCHSRCQLCCRGRCERRALGKSERFSELRLARAPDFAAGPSRPATAHVTLAILHC